MADKLLFTPGPLTTHSKTKSAMLHDLGSRDYAFIETVQSIRNGLLRLGNVSQETGYETVIMQGSGTFGIEAVLSCSVKPEDHLLIVINGAYGARMREMAKIHQLNHSVLIYPENEPPKPSEIRQHIEQSKQPITHLAIVHCETTTGIINPVEEVGAIAHHFHITYIVDAMSSFGAVPLDLAAHHIHFLVSSANKCIEGVPGFSFILAEREALMACEGHSRTLSLDLFAQWKGLEKNGQFRFTPPTHALLAFKTAMDLLEEEGGVAARGDRYRQNQNILREGMAALGFRELLNRDLQGYIISTFEYPTTPGFHFETFYAALNHNGFVIYPGKLGHLDCFRIGSIGQIYPKDVHALLREIEQYMKSLSGETKAETDVEKSVHAPLK